MNAPLTKKEIAAVKRAQWAARRLVAETPAFLSGPQLVAALMVVLQGDADQCDRPGCAGIAAGAIAAAAIAALVEAERAAGNNERTVVA